MTSYKSIKYDFSGTEIEDIPQSPTVTGITPSSYSEAQIPATLAVTGTGFLPGTTWKLKGNNGTEYAITTVSYTSNTAVTVTVPTSVKGVNNDPFDLVAENSVTGEGSNLFTVDDNPIFATPAGSLGTILDGQRSTYSLSPATATDPEGQTVSYAITTGAVSPGLSFNTSTAAITGTAAAVPSGTVESSFTVRATAGSQTSDRAFSITVAAPTQANFTTAGAGTYTMPATASTTTLLVAGSGGGSQPYGGGGGGGGLVLHPSYSISSGSNQYYIGSGGTGGGSAPSQNQANGGNSQWGNNDGVAVTTAAVITAIGGGHGSGKDGGSAGGGSHSSTGGTAIQTTSPTISADSKTYGFGSNGGNAPYGGPLPSGGGGGAGGAGGTPTGGSGKDVSATFGTGIGQSGVFSKGGGGGNFTGSVGSNPATANSGNGGGSGNAGSTGMISIKY